MLCIFAAILVIKITSTPQLKDVELPKIKGIEKETQAQIDSGEWPLFMVKDMMKKGLLPPHEFDEDEAENNFNVPGEEEKKGAKKDNKIVTIPGTNGTLANSSQEPSPQNQTGTEVGSGRQVGRHVGIPGHCEKDPHITCDSFEDCKAVTGACVWWYCTVDIMKSCRNTNDCGDSGGICSGPGYCQSFPEAVCQTDRDCEAFGGACVVGGYCLKNPNYSCLDDIDCDSHDRCSYHEPRWWRANEDFPQDQTFGPYPNWTDHQLRQKMMIAMRKIVHVQRDLEQQVPINSRLADYIRRVRRNQTRWEALSPVLLDDSQRTMRALTRNSSARVAALVRPLNESAGGFVAALRAHDRARAARVAKLRATFAAFDARRDSTTRRLVRQQRGTLRAYNASSEELRRARAGPLLLSGLEARWNASFAAFLRRYGEALLDYNATAAAEFSEGYAGVETSLRPVEAKTARFLAAAAADLDAAQSGLARRVGAADARLGALRNESARAAEDALAALRGLAAENDRQAANASALV